MTDQPNRRTAAWLRTGVRIGLIVCFAFAANYGLNFLQGYFLTMATPGAHLMLTGIVVVSLLINVILMAIPFIPGVEIGLSLLVMQGSSIAPFVFLATFFGLTLAYLVGRFLPYQVLHDLFADLGLKSACGLLERLKPLGREERLEMMHNNLPKWMAGPLIRYRYLTVAVALNVPGNAFIGGGGGIALMAGLSHTFDTRAILIWFAVAVAPVPLAVFLFGDTVVYWF